MNNLNICIAGLGNVGSALINSIEENNKYFNSKSSLNISIIGISGKTKSKKRNFNIQNYKWYDNPLEMVSNEECDVIVELIGQEKGLSYDLIKLALNNKKHVVTGNKALIANNGKELFELADKHSLALSFEAAVAGGIPIIKTIKNDNGLNRSAIDTEVLNLSKDLENFLKIELPNSRFFSLNNLLESAKRIQKNNKEKLSDENLRKEIVNNQSMEDLKLVSEDRNILRLTGLIEDKTSDEMKVLYTKLDSIGSEFPKDVKLEYTGTTLVALKTNDYLVQALVNSLGLALFFISLIMAYLFRANSILFISLITNLVPIFTILGLLAWLSISIRPPTAMTFAVALGIAVDDSLHFLLRYKKELSKGLSRLEAIQSTIINTGSALMITTTVLVAGFSVLLFSAFLPTYQFGLLAAAMIGTALICDLTLLPALCLVLPNARNKRK